MLYTPKRFATNNNVPYIIEYVFVININCLEVDICVPILNLHIMKGS